ncbi:MAG: PIG-L family deacetylase [Candidatus Rokuibacteriota bacterium]|nr:MAG: PIG-L family deacetylase [Candidatus Rokubacteria bacterium]
MTDNNTGRVLVVTAHPDDPEFAAGGTIAKLVKEGRDVAYVIATNGNKGSSDRAAVPDRLVRVREEEQRNAARALGVTRVQFLGYEDGELEDSRRLRLDVTREIRRWRPDLIITSHPNRSFGNFFAWHRDHRTIAGVVLDCVYPLARDHMAFPELLPDHEPHKVREVHMIQWDAPQLIVDITETIDAQFAAARCHASQLADFAAFEARVRKRAAAIGKTQGFSYGEGFDRVVLPG